jgi:small subunit ribosomal protein S15
MHLTAELKQEIFKEQAGSVSNTGQSEAQIALFTQRIAFLTEHLKENKKDFSAELSLVKLVGKRRALLNYIANKDIFRYRDIISKLGIRK